MELNDGTQRRRIGAVAQNFLVTSPAITFFIHGGALMESRHSADALLCAMPDIAAKITAFSQTDPNDFEQIFL